MAAFNLAGGGNYALNSSIGSTDTSLTLVSFTEPVSGVPYTMTLLNTSIAYATIGPKTSSSEFVSFTGITQNADSTATLTGVTRGLAKKYPFTSSATFQLPHSGQSVFILSDAPQVFNQFASLANDETFTGLITFAQAPIGINPGGQPDASTTVKGVGRVSVAPVSSTIPIFVGDNDTRVPTTSQTAALVGNNTSIAVGSGNKFVTQTGFQNGAETTATFSGTNTITATYSPVPASLVKGQEFWGTIAVTNTGAVTFNPNSLGATAVKKLDGATALVAGDLVAGQYVGFKYDGTNMQLITPVGAPPTTPSITRGTLTISTSTSTAVTTTFLPKVIRVWATGNGSTANGTSYGGWDAVLGNSCIAASSTVQSGIETTAYFISYSNNANSNFATIGSVTSTGFTFTSTVAGGNVAILLWEAQQ